MLWKEYILSAKLVRQVSCYDSNFVFMIGAIGGPETEQDLLHIYRGDNP